MADKQKGLKLSAFKTDLDLEENGIWINYQSGARFKIARLYNRKFKEYILKHGKTDARGVLAGTADSEDSLNLMKDAIASTVLVDWDRILDDEGNKIPYTVEDARKALDIPDFYNEVYNMASERELFSLSDAEEAQKN